MTAIRVVSPSGSANAIQVKNSSGDFDTDANFVFDLTNKRLGIGTSSPIHKVHLVGDLSVTGSIFAKQYHITEISSSIIHVSGSTKFGDSPDDTHQFFGKLSTTGTAIFGTSSVAFNDHLPPMPGNNVSFFVSGNQGGSDGAPDSGVAVFGGDVVISGSLLGGSPLVIKGGAVFNDIGSPNANFRIESDNYQSAFYVKGSTDQVLILSGGAPASVNVSDGTDVNFYVSGSADSKNSSIRGTSVFGGDVVISGTLYSENIGTSRTKTIYEVTGTHTAGVRLNVVNADFSQGEFNPNKIDLFVNGQLMTSGSDKDYMLSGDSSGVEFSFQLLLDDLVSALVIH